MKTDELKTLAEKLLETFFNAGQKAIELRKVGLKTTLKSDNTPVTNGDLEVDRLLREKITKITHTNEPIKLSLKKLSFIKKVIIFYFPLSPEV